MRKLRVALVAPSFRILGGHAVQASRLIEAWRHDPDVYAWLVPINPLPPRLLRWAIRVKYLRTVVTQLTYLPLLIRELAHADVVHVFSASYASFFLAPLPAVLVAKGLRRPVLLNYRSGQAYDHLSRSPLSRAAIARANRTIVPSRYLVDVFASFNLKASAVPNLVDLERFRFRVREPLRPRLLSTRNFEPLYNVACTLRAFQIVQRRWPEATLTLVGGGSTERALRRLAADLHLRHVTFVGRVAPDEIAPFYADHDIYVQSPNIDNMPTSVLEAFASGLPVVATKAGGVPAILTDGVHGLLAPLDDAEGLADRVLQLLNQPDLARRLAQSAHATCERCTWPAVRDEWLSVYRSILPRSAEHESREPSHDLT